MYKEFYGFSEEPFALEPDLGFLFLTEHHKKILDSIVHGVTSSKGFILLTGERGAGKTILIYQLKLMLDPTINTVFIHQPSETFDELLKGILQDLNLPVEKQDKSLMLLQFHEYSFQRSSQNETLLIIVDEAQDLSEKVMEELRMLCNPDPRIPGPGFVQTILVGRLEIEEKLKSQDLRQLLQRIAVKCRLRPLSEGESREYIEHRLNKVGGDIGNVFTTDAIDLICRYSEGIPRSINMLCYMAICGGYVLSKKIIDAALVELVFPILGTLKPSRLEGMTRSIVALIDHIEDSHMITKITYMLLLYSFFVLLVLFWLKLLF